MNNPIRHTELAGLVDRWIDEGKSVVGPTWVKPGLCQYAPLRTADALVLTGYVRPANSIKEAVFPRHETVCTYCYEGREVRLGDADTVVRETIVVGARPCDAAALPLLDRVFNWDCADELYNRRRAALTVVAVGCTERDNDCFCTSMGLGPASNGGSDAILVPAADGTYIVEPVTDKGRALFPGVGKTDAAPATVAPPEDVVNTQWLRKFLTEEFDSPLWEELSARCHGCGACAYTCPTCHCFDIVDEGNADGGRRVRNWDACQFPAFTIHASGHNPRSTRAQRQRQRYLHKFRMFPEKFGVFLCTGCGNCTRNCPADLGILGGVRSLVAGMLRQMIETGQ